MGSTAVPLVSECHKAAVSTPPTAAIVEAWGHPHWGAVRAPVRRGWCCKSRYTKVRRRVGGGRALGRGNYCVSTLQAEMAFMGHQIHASMVLGDNGEGLLLSTGMVARGSFCSTGKRAVSE